MPIFSYRCKHCNREWEQYHKIKDRLKESCEPCQRVAILVPSAPSVQTFDSWIYTNKKEGHKIEFTSTKQRDAYLAKRGLHVTEGDEVRNMRDKIDEVESRKRAQYKVERKIVNGKKTRVVTPT